MRRAKTTALLACLAAVVLGGCGSSDDKGKPIPAATKQELDKQLDSIKARFDFGGAGACSDIAENKQSVEKTIDSLPDDTDADVKGALQDGFDHLFQLTDEQCDEKKGQNTDTETTESEPAPTPTVESQPETTPTTPSETTPAQTTPSDKKPKQPKQNNGNGGGNSTPQSGAGGGVEAPGELP
jgi:hypothetical protein